MNIATETGQSHPANRKLGIIILGASAFPHYPASRNLNNVSFARSAAAFRNLIADEEMSVFGKPAILDLFDVEDDPASVIRRVKEFLKSAPALTDILFYYCGHGDFLPDRTYYLTLKVTEPDNEAFTGLPLRQMRLALETQLMMKRVFLVFDCCFSGQAAKEWMSAGIGHVIEEQIFQSFPKRGTALIAASARSGPAIAPAGESLTMFTGALVNTVSTGVAGEKRELSFRDIVDEVRARISERYGSAGVAPEIHAPRQDEGDITFTPFFVNRAFVPPPEFKAEREGFEFAVADLERWLPNTRVGAVVTLEELLSSTQSAAFRVEILNKLRDVKEKDDSQRVRTKCEEVLARWPELPIVVLPVTPSEHKILQKPSGEGESILGGSPIKKSILARLRVNELSVIGTLIAILVLLPTIYFLVPKTAEVRGMSVQDIVNQYGNGTAQITRAWRLYDQTTGKPVFHQTLSNPLGENERKTYPAYVRLPGNLGVVRWLTLEDDNRTNIPIGGRARGTAFVVSEQGFMLTNKHVAAAWNLAFGGEDPATEYRYGWLYELGGGPGAKEQALKTPMMIDLGADEFQSLKDWVPTTGGVVFAKDKAFPVGQGNIPDPSRGGTRTFVGRNDVLEVTFANSRSGATATLQKFSSDSDTALIKVDTPHQLKKLDLATDDTVTVGEQVIAIGYPSVAEQTVATSTTIENGQIRTTMDIVPQPFVSVGNVAMISPAVKTENGVTIRGALGDIIQMSINSNGAGNSGGPVFNKAGKVIGLFTYGIYSRGGATSGAIPIKYGRDLLTN